ncbi:hypothetical protein BDZ94DRAFT_785470 [Collybia nuda]|uniref:Protein-S-isoprenylcysteine O-methyltransferase n=1 Tax=Collybia nuda TaxID=64659 RepID=A0A9P5YGX6_9AGAR|nr:hypothetical protein BDZ94DRAFT_785470 [Collybia nuda]
MSSESLLKLPSVLLATLGLQLCFTLPGITAEGDEAPILDRWDRFMKIMGRLMRPIKNIIWAVGIAEVVTIITFEIQISPRVSQILAALYLYGSAQNICLTPLSAVGVLFISFGTLVEIQCHRAMKDLFTFELCICKDHSLVKTGPYNIVRHPGYAGLLATYFGMFCWFGARGSWLRESGLLETLPGSVFFATLAIALGGLLLGFLRRMRTEDEALGEVFGLEWEEWAEKVPYSLIPYVY